VPAVSKKAVCSHDDALAVLMELRRAGHIAYFAGGCVRDTLLGLEPKDWDVATDAPPDRVRQLFRNTQAVGHSFGVILVRTNGSTIEVATFRSDGQYTDGRRPDSVRFATPQEDAQRRDFTINGLYLDPVDNRVIDFIDGQRDLQTRTLRAIGNPEHRFAEDYLRMLRAVRFAARFDLTIEPDTARAIVANAHKLPRISPERIGDELRAMLVPRTRVSARDQLHELGLLPVLLRQLPTRRARATCSTDLLRALSSRSEGPVPHPQSLAAIALDHVGIDAHSPALSESEVRQCVKAFRDTLRLNNDDTDALRECLNLREMLATEPPRVCRQKRFLAQRFGPDALAILKSHASVEGLSDLVDARAAQLEAFAATDFAPQPFVTGDDLVQMGHKPGPKFKTVLDTTYDAQLEDRVATREAALALARELIALSTPA
jgi:poly(A) polymerase